MWRDAQRGSMTRIRPLTLYGEDDMTPNETRDWFNAHVRELVNKAGEPVRLGNVTFSVEDDRLCYSLPGSQWDTSAIDSDLRKTL